MLNSIINNKLKNTPSEVIFREISREWTYQEFADTVRQVAQSIGKIKDLGHKVVGIKCTVQYDHMVLIFALDLLGLASVSLPEGFGSMFRGYVDVVKPDLILTDTDFNIDIPKIVFSGLNFPVDIAATQAITYQEQPESACRYSVAAGTDANPRKFYVSGKTCAQNIHRLTESVNALKQAAKYDVFCFLGVDLLSGFQIRLASLISGGCINFFTRADIHYLFRRDGHTVFILSPLHLEVLISVLPPMSQPDDRAEVIVIGGALPFELEKQTRARLTNRIHVVYGTEETGVVSVKSSHDSLSPESAGFIVPWMQVEVVDKGNVKIEENNVSGLIRLAGDTMNKEYIQEYFSDHFRDGWFYPGDMGRIHNKKELFIESRADDLMSFGGDKFPVNRLEAASREFPGVEDICIFSAPDKHGIEMPYLGVVGPQVIDVSDLSVKLHDMYENLPTLTVIWIDHVPYLEGGKPDRALLRDIVINDQKNKTSYMS